MHDVFGKVIFNLYMKGLMMICHPEMMEHDCYHLWNALHVFMLHFEWWKYRACDVHLTGMWRCMWCASDGHVEMHGMYMWWACEMHVMYMWWACEMHVMYIWWACEMHVFTCDVHVTFSMQIQCTFSMFNLMLNKLDKAINQWPG